MKMRDSFTLDPREVRQIATKVNIPFEQDLPIVSVEGDIDNPSLYPAKDLPAGYLIEIPMSSIRKRDKDTYTLGPKARGYVKHELVHFATRIEDPKLEASCNMTPKRRIAYEMDAEIKAKTGLPITSFLASTIQGITEEYKIPARESIDLVRKEALRRGISKSTISKGELVWRNNWGKE